MALFGRAQRAADVDAVGDVGREQLDVAALDLVEGVLAVPERVVGVDADDLEPVHCVPRPRRPLLAARSLALTRSHRYRSIAVLIG